MDVGPATIRLTLSSVPRTMRSCGLSRYSARMAPRPAAAGMQSTRARAMPEAVRGDPPYTMAKGASRMDRTAGS